MAERTTKQTVRLVIIVVLAVVLLLFVAVNTERVEVDLLLTDIELPLVVVLLGTAVLSGLIAALVTRRRN